jgi:hypothetical protein
MLLYVEGMLPVEKRQSLENHVGMCSDCARQFATLARLVHVLKEDVPVRVDGETFRKAIALVSGTTDIKGWTFRIFSSPARAALAGVSLLAITLTAYLLLPRPEPEQFRSTDGVVPMLSLSPADGATITEPRPEFHWSPVSQSSVYRFSLMDHRGVRIWDRDVRDTTVLLPPGVVLVPGNTYLWRVESFLADRSLERSTLHVFTYTLPQ